MRLLNLVVVPLVSAKAVNTQQQIPIIGDVGALGSEIVRPKTYEITNEDAPAIGVHFTLSYAIASARYQNGTIRDLVKVAGDADYIDLMSRWANGEDDINMNHDCRYFATGSSADRFSLERAECRRLFLESSSRGLSGLQISRDAGVLSVFITKVRGAVEKELGAPITSIAPAFPRLLSYVQKDVRHAFAHAGLLSTRRHSETLVYMEVYAAYAALGHGLCEPWMNYTRCISDPKLQHQNTVLYFNFDNSSFNVGAMDLKSAFQRKATFSYAMDTTLGWWNLPVFEVPRAKFWAQIHELIMAVVRPMASPPNRIVLLGEHGADEEFKEVVKAAVWEVLEFDVELMLEAVQKKDVGFLAARGAAELGWRNENWIRQNEALRGELRAAQEL